MLRLGRGGLARAASGSSKDALTGSLREKVTNQQINQLTGCTGFIGWWAQEKVGFGEALPATGMMREERKRGRMRARAGRIGLSKAG